MTLSILGLRVCVGGCVPKKVVCIEDDPDILDLLTAVLQGPDLEMYPALGGEQGLAMVRQTLPDLVLLDLFMPAMNGWDLLKAMRQDVALQKTPVVMVSACHIEISSALYNGLDLEVVDYVRKPFSSFQIRTTVERALGL